MTGTGSTEVHVLDGRRGFQSFLLQTGTLLHETGEDFDFSVVDLTLNGRTDGRLDLLAIKKWNTAGSVEVHVLSGAHRFGRWVLQTGTAIPAVQHNIHSYAQVVRSATTGFPQLAIVNRSAFPGGTHQPGSVYYLNGTPLNWNGGFHGFIQGGSAPQADVTLGYCG